ncbi:hypothetical protein BDN70DRAFT_555714 [Pholiota conissans]|uniref:Uncharacterized protein n=1 Tax=Pholiota conissans TaxID=109636 RepID=A0A9P5YKP3_9AGAR|nr:hypothetical protein BDN70DRAFT_555714 [Pholiota conissans]
MPLGPVFAVSSSEPSLAIDILPSKPITKCVLISLTQFFSFIHSDGIILNPFAGSTYAIATLDVRVRLHLLVHLHSSSQAQLFLLLPRYGWDHSETGPHASTTSHDNSERRTHVFVMTV